MKLKILILLNLFLQTYALFATHEAESKKPSRVKEPLKLPEEGL